jgi:galactonate dehydratase
MNRRTFLKRAAASGAFLALGAVRRPELTISRVVVQLAKGRRLTPVAPNAYAKYRGYDVSEPIVRIQTRQGLEGIGRYQTKPEVLQKLIGADPFALFRWERDVITGPANEELPLYGSDVALFDLIGKAMKVPIAELLGDPVRESVRVYDSSLYMEDLLTPQELEGVAYLKGNIPEVPAERVARKALWVLDQPEGIRILKIKIGRAKWMGLFDEALARDIAVVQAIRKAVGQQVILFVDGNNGYDARPLGAADFAEAVADERVYAMEEMFSEKKVDDLRELKRRMRAKLIPTKLADGENDRDGVPLDICRKIVDFERGIEPLIDIEQADMNANGYLRTRRIARERARYRMTVAPHNFGSKLGFWSQIHLGLAMPNWEFCETDDSQFPAFTPDGIQVKGGLASARGFGLGVTLNEKHLEAPTLVLGG